MIALYNWPDSFSLCNPFFCGEVLWCQLQSEAPQPPPPWSWAECIAFHVCTDPGQRLDGDNYAGRRSFLRSQNLKESKKTNPCLCWCGPKLCSASFWYRFSKARQFQCNCLLLPHTFRAEMPTEILCSTLPRPWWCEQGVTSTREEEMEIVRVTEMKRITETGSVTEIWRGEG